MSNVATLDVADAFITHVFSEYIKAIIPALSEKFTCASWGLVIYNLTTIFFLTCLFNLAPFITEPDLKMDARRNATAVETGSENHGEGRSSCHSGNESSTGSNHGRTRLVRHAAPQGSGKFLHLLPFTVLVTQHGVQSISKRYKQPKYVCFGY